MEIIGKIEGIKYQICLVSELKVVEFSELNVNEMPTTCLVKNKRNFIAISKWVSPKRTRSYPYERVYNSLSTIKRLTIIPIVKDEGLKGDRDFLQWDTVALMSLLDVYVIFAYYDSAEINPNNQGKITNQQFNNEFVKSKIVEFENYHSSALHWNLKELNENLHNLIDTCIQSYQNIQEKTNVKMHHNFGLTRFKEKIGTEVQSFMEFSRIKSKDAQQREYVTTQPKESLSTLSKSKITISNYLGGLYYFTVDEIELKNDFMYLIECKHSKNNLLPSLSDIKDGLLKMILYCNLSTTFYKGNEVFCKSILKITSSKLNGNISSLSSYNEIEKYFDKNLFSNLQREFIMKLFNESKMNGFEIQISYSI